MTKMSDIAYVVVSTPRSGTGYAAEMLNSLGLNCGHEQAFRPGVCHYKKPEEVWGESSWLAAPFLAEMPSTTLVLHQIRNPVKTLDSMMARRQLRGRWKPEHNLPRGEYTNFLKTHVSDWESCDHKERLIRFWVEWHTRIEDGIRDSDLQYLRYRVEDVNESLLHSIAKKVGVEVSSEQVESALATGTAVNHRLGPANKVTPWSEEYLNSHNSKMIEKLRSMSEGYGYA